MMTPASKQLGTTAEQFVERYKVTPSFFVRHCLLPSLIALTRVTCFYQGVLVETLEVPAWKTRLRALRTVFAMTSAVEIEKKQIRTPLGALGPAQLTTMADAFPETEWCPTTTEFLVAKCLKPALDAVNITCLFYQGRLVDSLQTRDCATQLEALEIALKAKKAFPNEYDNIHFATYRDIALLVPRARQRRTAIQIVRPTQLVHMR
jgi:hypothetical protein